MDRAYLYFQRLYQIHQCSAVFVIRSKTNTGLRRVYSQKVDKTTGVNYRRVVSLPVACGNIFQMDQTAFEN